MLDDLRLLADAVDKISVDQARQVVDAVNRRLSKAMRSSMIRVYWRSESESGVIFSPVTHTAEDYLDEPRQFELAKSPRGLIAWVFENKKTLRVEGIQEHIEKKRILYNLDDPEDQIGDDYLWFGYPSNDCAYIFPLMINGQVRGIFSIEGEASETARFRSDEAFKYINQVVQNIGTLLDRAYDTESELAKRRRGVKRFLDKIRSYRIPTEIFTARTKTCFIAMPFANSERKKAAELITKELESECAVKADIYTPDEENYIIDGITKQIKESHFCIADITGLNPNVMLEIGMMMMLEKSIILIKEKSDKSNFPFDINQRAIYRYEIDHDQDTMCFPQSGKKTTLDLANFLKERVEILKKEDDSFLLAQDHIVTSDDDE